MPCVLFVLHPYSTSSQASVPSQPFFLAPPWRSQPLRRTGGGLHSVAPVAPVAGLLDTLVTRPVWEKDE